MGFLIGNVKRLNVLRLYLRSAPHEKLLTRIQNGNSNGKNELERERERKKTVNQIIFEMAAFREYPRSSV